MAIDPAAKVAYVTNAAGSVGTVSGYTIKKGGALVQVKDSPFPAGTNPWGVAIDPTGKFAYVANYGYGSNPGNVSAYAISRSGVLAQVKGSPFKAGTHPFWVAIDPTGKFAYVTNEDSDNVSGYAINASSGVLTQVKGSPFAAGDAPGGVAIR